MSYPETEIDKIGSELHELTEAYAAKAESLASDPYFRAAIVKTSVSGFTWSLYHAFDGPVERRALAEELTIQRDATTASYEATYRRGAACERPLLQAIDHVQVAIPRGGEGDARRFYGDFLGLGEQPKPANLAARGGCWFESGSVKVHCGVEDPFHAARKAHIAFRVDSVAALTSRAREAGFETSQDEPLPGHDRVYIYDPFGNRLEFLRPTAPHESH